MKHDVFAERKKLNIHLEQSQSRFIRLRPSLIRESDNKTTEAGLALFDSFLILRGIKPLAVRMERQQENALKSLSTDGGVGREETV